MAVRERQLGALGMRSNERGQVTAQCSLTQQVADLAEEAGAVCCICREGYKYQPTKVSVCLLSCTWYFYQHIVPKFEKPSCQCDLNDLF